MKGDTEYTNSNELKVQPIDMQHHREALRRALLASPYWSKKQRHLVPFWEGDNKPMFKRLASVGGALGVLAIVLVTTLVLTSNAHVASAKEIAQKSYQAVSALPPDQLGALQQTIKEDPSELLAEANNAKDLKTLTYDQAVSEYPELTDAPAPRGEGKTVDLRNLTFLQFTNSSGATILLGIGDNDGSRYLPMLSLSRSADPGAPPKGTSVKSTLRNDGSGPIYEYNGRKYTVPAGTGSPDGRHAIEVRVEGDDVYINGQKATPVP
jgi:hypothetical protein